MIGLLEFGPTPDVQQIRQEIQVADLHPGRGSDFSQSVQGRG